MSLREIAPAEWATFLEQFSREHRAWRVTVERVDPEGTLAHPTIEGALDAVVPDVTAHRLVGIEIRLQPEGKPALEIQLPKTLRVEETDEGAVRALEIDNERGGRTRIQFRATALPEALDGVAPGEL